jgi:2-octaprenyl-6-methoxyphenol hydroxylase
MDLPEYDVAIIGAGPVGSALALLLAGLTPCPARIALIGKQFTDTAPARPGSAIDPRTLALNHGSRVLLEQLGAWPAESADIETVHVSQRGRLGRTLIQHTEMGVPRLGSVVAYDTLLASLHSAVRQSGVSLIEAPQGHAGPPAAQQIQLDLGTRTVSCRLAVQSDGNRSDGGRRQGIRRDYRQHAILATVRAGQPKQAWAFERFTAQGPLAVLPHPQGAGLYGIVWCCAPERADVLMQLDDAAFAAALHDTFGERLGRFECTGRRHAFALALNAGPALVNARTVAIGNAAQTLHPVAGQGLNLGLRDAAQLSHAIGGWLTHSDASPEPALNQFARKRRSDRWLTAGITDVLPRLFATRNPLIQHACGLSLLALDSSPLLRVPLARHLLQGLRS